MKLTVSKTVYGTHKRPVIQLNYHNGGSRPTFDIYDVDDLVEIFELIQLAQEKGCEVRFEGFEKYKDQFNDID